LGYARNLSVSCLLADAPKRYIARFLDHIGASDSWLFSGVRLVYDVPPYAERYDSDKDENAHAAMLAQLVSPTMVVIGHAALDDGRINVDDWNRVAAKFPRVPWEVDVPDEMYLRNIQWTLKFWLRVRVQSEVSGYYWARDDADNYAAVDSDDRARHQCRGEGNCTGRRPAPDFPSRSRYTVERRPTSRCAIRAHHAGESG
jgi:hypothetical protein